MATVHAPSIEVFQDLRLSSPGHTRSSLREILLSRVAPPWRHAEDRERTLDEISKDALEHLIFERSAAADLPASVLVLFGEGNGYKISNIFPQKIGDLSISEYNDVLGDFREKLLRCNSEIPKLSMELTQRYQSITDWISSDAALALHTFSVCANKWTGSAHPADRKRWFRFLTAAYEGDRSLDTYLLERWLTEVEEWPHEIAHKLVTEYEYSMDLIDFRAAMA